MGGQMTFPNGEHDSRTDVTIHSRSQSIHHRSRSFENLPVDMIKCFPSEPTHMIYLGVTKKLISLWKELAIKRLNRMDQSISASINEALDLCYEKCYGTEHLIYNMHSLKHIAEDVIEHGSLESFSAFPLESYMRRIRRSVHCGFAAAKQAAQRYAEELYFQSVSDRRTEQTDTTAIVFPLRTHQELRSLEAALDEQKFRDHF
ncbi:unnamed protein product, partial [Schistosoma mattheei]